MKRVLMAVFAGVLIIGSVAIASAAPPPVSVNIPFAFHAGDVELPAGEYIITVGGRFTLGTDIVIKAKDGSEYYVPSLPDEMSRADNDYRLTFSKYGDTCFLSKVQVGATGATMFKSRDEKRMAALWGKNAPSVTSLLK